MDNLIEEESRTCKLCNETKPITAFGWSDNTHRRRTCYRCESAVKREKRKDDPVWRERQNNNSKLKLRRYRRSLPTWSKYIVHKLKTRADRKGVPFLINSEDIVRAFPLDGHCPVLGILLTFGPTTSSSASVDRIIPSFGYVPSNIRIISYRANEIKKNASVEEIEAVVRWMRSLNSLREPAADRQLVAVNQVGLTKRENRTLANVVS